MNSNNSSDPSSSDDECRELDPDEIQWITGGPLDSDPYMGYEIIGSIPDLECVENIRRAEEEQYFDGELSEFEYEIDDDESRWNPQSIEEFFWFISKDNINQPWSLIAREGARMPFRVASKDDFLKKKSKISPDDRLLLTGSEDECNSLYKALNSAQLAIAKLASDSLATYPVNAMNVVVNLAERSCFTSDRSTRGQLALLAFHIFSAQEKWAKAMTELIKLQFNRAIDEYNDGFDIAIKKQVRSRRFDLARFRNEHPELYQQYLSEKSYDRLTVSRLVSEKELSFDCWQYLDEILDASSLSSEEIKRRFFPSAQFHRKSNSDDDDQFLYD